MTVIAILFPPVIAAILIGVLLKGRWAAGATIVSSIAALVMAARMALIAAAGGSVDASLGPSWHAWVAVDGLSALIILMVSFVATTASIYSVGYVGHEHLTPRKVRLYYASYNLFVFSMLAIPLLAEPTLVWIVVELTTLTSALLVSFDDTPQALEAAWKYVVLSLMGAGLALFGFLVLFAAMRAGGGGDYTWTGLAGSVGRMPPLLLRSAFLLILIGLGTKVGLVPMHTWLPDAHSQAPSPICALLSGIETTAILYVILRLMPIMRKVPAAHADSWALALGLLSVGVAAFLLLQVRDYKRLFAFSTVEHMGVILAGAGLGGVAGDYGAMQQIVNHSVTKSFCFFAAGAVLLALGTREIAAVRGLVRRSPFAGSALVLGGLAIAGAPPFAVFLSEFAILRAGLAQGKYVATALLALFIVIAFFGVMAHVNRMAFGADRDGTGEDEGEDEGREPEPIPAPASPIPMSCRLAMVLAAIPVIVLGIYVPPPLHDLIAAAAAALGR